MMRYRWLLPILLAASGGAQAEEASEDEWDQWDQLPDDILELNKEANPEALSRQLDRLIENNPESERLDELLALWLEQAAQASDRRGIPLSAIIELSRPPEGELPEPARERREQVLEKLLEQRPGNNGQPAESAGPPADSPKPVPPNP